MNFSYDGLRDAVGLTWGCYAKGNSWPKAQACSFDLVSKEQAFSYGLANQNESRV